MKVAKLKLTYLILVCCSEAEVAQAVTLLQVLDKGEKLCYHFD